MSRIPGLEVRELTPRGRGGLSVLAVDGPRAAAALAALGAPPADGGEPRLVRLHAGGELLDEALLWRRGVGRFELGLHGSPAVVRRVAAELEAAGGPRSAGASVEAPQAASKGEGGGVEERAWRRCGAAPTEAGARLLLDQAQGALRRELERLVLESPERWRAGLRALAERGRAWRGTTSALRVVLWGPVNAGKSTLFNALVGRERVVVSEERGTTRDAVTERVLLGPWAVDLVDTAGERAEGGDLEVRGRDVGRRRRTGADLVVWLAPGDAAEPDRTPPAEPLGVPLRVVTSRADLAPPGGLGGGPALSALADPEGARSVLADVVGEALRLPARPWLRGRAVPLEEDLPALVALASRTASDERWPALARLLGPRPARPLP